MPCRSSRASISFRPRDRCDRSRRPIGASGGGSGFEGATIRAGATCLGEAAGFGATLLSASAEATDGFEARRLRNGLTCLATLSHSARSSSLRPRLRRGGSGNSGIELDGRRFIDDGDIGAGDADAALRKPLQPWAAAREAAPASPRQPGPPGVAKAPLLASAVLPEPRAWCWSPRSPRAASPRSSAPWTDLSAARFAGTVLRSVSDGRASGTGILRPRATGSRLFGTRMTKRAL